MLAARTLSFVESWYHNALGTALLVDLSFDTVADRIGTVGIAGIVDTEHIVSSHIQLEPNSTNPMIGRSVALSARLAQHQLGPSYRRNAPQVAVDVQQAQLMYSDH